VSIVVLSSYCRISPASSWRTFSWMVLLGEHGLVNDVHDGDRG